MQSISKIKFKCQKCGKCCSGEIGAGFVWVSKEDIENIASFLKMSFDDFMKKYTRICFGKVSLIEKPNFDCIFYENKKCKIYNSRPIQCATYPWWPNILKDEKSLNSIKEDCPGLDAPDAKEVDPNYITKQKNKCKKNKILKTS
jgi:uncharacterized protein